MVVVRFGHDWTSSACRWMRCASGDRHMLLVSTQPLQVLASVSEKIKNFAVVYLVDISEVPDFNTMYELYDPCTVMFFFRNKVGICTRWKC